jgi:hypothetical protein
MNLVREKALLEAKTSFRTKLHRPSKKELYKRKQETGKGKVQKESKPDNLFSPAVNQSVSKLIHPQLRSAN